MDFDDDHVVFLSYETVLSSRADKPMLSARLLKETFPRINWDVAETLFLDHCGIRFMSHPQGRGREKEELPDLQELYLDNNALTRVDGLHPLLQNLTYLSVASNSLTVLNNMQAFTNLRVLNLAGNMLTKLPDMRHCSQLCRTLEILNVTYNQISTTESFIELLYFEALKKLDFRWNPIMSMAEGEKQLHRDMCALCVILCPSVVEVHGLILQTDVQRKALLHDALPTLHKNLVSLVGGDVRWISDVMISLRDGGISGWQKSCDDTPIFQLRDCLRALEKYGEKSSEFSPARFIHQCQSGLKPASYPTPEDIAGDSYLDQVPGDRTGDLFSRHLSASVAERLSAPLGATSSPKSPVDMKTAKKDGNSKSGSPKTRASPLAAPPTSADAKSPTRSRGSYAAEWEEKRSVKEKVRGSIRQSQQKHIERLKNSRKSAEHGGERSKDSGARRTVRSARQQAPAEVSEPTNGIDRVARAIREGKHHSELSQMYERWKRRNEKTQRGASPQVYRGGNMVHSPVGEILNSSPGKRLAELSAIASPHPPEVSLDSPWRESPPPSPRSHSKPKAATVFRGRDRRSAPKSRERPSTTTAGKDSDAAARMYAEVLDSAASKHMLARNLHIHKPAAAPKPPMKLQQRASGLDIAMSYMSSVVHDSPDSADVDPNDIGDTARVSASTASSSPQLAAAGSSSTARPAVYEALPSSSKLTLSALGIGIGMADPTDAAAPDLAPSPPRGARTRAFSGINLATGAMDVPDTAGETHAESDPAELPSSPEDEAHRDGLRERVLPVKEMGGGEAEVFGGEGEKEEEEDVHEQSFNFNEWVAEMTRVMP